MYDLIVPFCSLIQDAFSLLAYSDPWNCPVGQQLDPIQREPVCAALNSAILGKVWFLCGCYPQDIPALKGCPVAGKPLLGKVQKYLCLALASLYVVRD